MGHGPGRCPGCRFAGVGLALVMERGAPVVRGAAPHQNGGWDVFGEFEIDGAKAIGHLVHLAIAYVLALPIGWDREARARSAGVRTFPLVAVGACAYMLASLHFLGAAADAHARVIYGIITGIGFIGGGAILKQDDGVTGTATAASIWSTGAIGIAVALDRFEIAIVLAAINYATLRFGRRLKDRANRGAGSSQPDHPAAAPPAAEEDRHR